MVVAERDQLGKLCIGIERRRILYRFDEYVYRRDLYRHADDSRRRHDGVCIGQIEQPDHEHRIAHVCRRDDDSEPDADCATLQNDAAARRHQYLLGIIILSATYHLPICIFLYTNFIKTIPIELDEAAKIDGCRTISIFYKMILPQLGPVTASIVIITSISTYNEYLFPLYFLQKADMRMITTYITTFFNENSYVNAASAVAILGAMPAILVFLVFQKHFVSGAMSGMTK